MPGPGTGSAEYTPPPGAFAVPAALTNNQPTRLYVAVNEAPLNPLHPKYGAKGDGVTDDTTAIQQALTDAAATPNRVRPVELGPSPAGAFYAVQQLRLKAGQILCGQPGGMFDTRIQRIGAGGSPFIRELTPGEGGNGAQGVSIKDLYIDCNGVSGTGIDLGNQGGADWGFNGELIAVHVRNAGVGGDGFFLNADAVTARNISAYFNNGIGLHTAAGHGDNNWFETSLSQNVGGEADIGGSDDSFFGLHSEPIALEAIIVRGGGTVFHNATFFLFANVTDLFDLKGSISGVCIYNGAWSPNGFAATNWVNCEITPANSLASVGASGIRRLTAWIDSPDNSPLVIANTLHGTKIATDNNSQLEARGFWRTGITSQSASYTVTASDSVIIFTGSTAAQTITLPTGAGNRGREITIINKATVAVTVAATSGTVDTTNLAASTRATYISDGTNWNQVA